MIIIVEGPDGAGKTTLVEKLLAAATDPIALRAAPPDPPDRDVFEEYEQPLVAFAPHEVVICDRWHWGEVVYGPLLRKSNRLHSAAWRHVELELLTHGAIVVTPMHPYPVLEWRLTERGDDLVSTGDLHEILAGYEWCREHTALPVVQVGDTDDVDAADLLQVAHTLCYRPADLVSLPTYVGRPRPVTLLVGEKRGGEAPHADRGAFVPRLSSSGSYLLRNLSETMWRNVALVNALECDLQLVWHLVGKPPVVALGRTADAKLSEAGIYHATVPHPQYVRRFHHASGAEYGQLIESLAGTKVNQLRYFHGR